MKIRAKFQCQSVKKYPGETNQVELTALTPQGRGDNLTDEEKAFWQATPQGKVEITVTRQELANFFIPGKKYDLTFEAGDES